MYFLCILCSVFSLFFRYECRNLFIASLVALTIEIMVLGKYVLPNFTPNNTIKIGK